MTKQEFDKKVQIEVEYIFETGENSIRVIELVKRMAKLYATEKVKEALRVVAERACDVSEADGELLAHFIGELETELVEKLNKEI